MPSSTISLGHHHHAFVNAEAVDAVSAMGSLIPRLSIKLKLRTPRERIEAEIHYLRMQVKFANELIGEGSAAGEYVNSIERRLSVEVPITRAALDFVNEQLVGDQVELHLGLQGWMRIRYELDQGEQAYAPGPGQWWFTTFGVQSIAELLLQVPRSEWFKRVLEPIGNHEYLLTEIHLLKGGIGASLGASYKQLREAERHYASGNDPSVFFYCKGAIEALPGWPSNIFDSVIDRTQAERLSALVKSAKDYFDHGRHIAQEGAWQGDFPVDHREALFALNLSKVLLAQTATVLGAR
jgi:hypothetical protein